VVGLERARPTLARRRYRYTGKEKDEETGLAYHGARYYAPWLGRWERPDPKPNPKWSRYEYCRCSPTNHLDADGAEPKTVQQQAAENLAAQGVAKAQEVEGNIDLLDPMANLINLGAWALKDTPASLLAQGKPSEAAGRCSR
jgi:RHS repeat-associated protein